MQQCHHQVSHETYEAVDGDIQRLIDEMRNAGEIEKVDSPNNSQQSTNPPSGEVQGKEDIAPNVEDKERGKVDTEDITPNVEDEEEGELEAEIDFAPNDEGVFRGKVARPLTRQLLTPQGEIRLQVIAVCLGMLHLFLMVTWRTRMFLRGGNEIADDEDSSSSSLVVSDVGGNVGDDSNSNVDSVAEWDFLEQVVLGGFLADVHIMSEGIHDLRDKQVDCLQWYVGDIFLQAIKMIEQKLPCSAYEGNAPPVCYAAFRELLEPFINTQVWGRLSEDRQHKLKVMLGHFKSQVQQSYGFVEFYQKFSFLKTDVASWTGVGLQRPHWDMDMEVYQNSKTILGFMPLETCGMFLEVWPPDSQVAEVFLSNTEQSLYGQVVCSCRWVLKPNRNKCEKISILLFRSSAGRRASTDKSRSSIRAQSPSNTKFDGGERSICALVIT